MKKLSVLLLFTLYACQCSPAFADTVTSAGVMLGIALCPLLMCLIAMFIYFKDKLCYKGKAIGVNKSGADKVVSYRKGDTIVLENELYECAYTDSNLSKLEKGTKSMPIKKGSGQKVISSNIKEIMDSYKQKGTIGTSKPANKKKALKQAIAISESSARKSVGKKKTKKK